ncbi:MAG TPA: hypothetical protein VEW45_04830, partial [Candidatus Dormibacteraeota bacterium]|nr:hypothetical protein [Candidatus Dormibacteraeota bacterium]
MNDRALASAIADRIGPDALVRLKSLRRRLWMRRAVAVGVLCLAGALVGKAIVQLVARTVA